MTRWAIRRGGAADAPALAEVFWRGVREGAAPRYTPAQRAAWLPARPEPLAFAARLARQTVFLAEDGAGALGFMTLDPRGRLDLAYVLPRMRRTGLADALLAMILNHAAATGLSRLTTRASEMARPFFARNGWRITGPAVQRRGGVTIPATDMAFDMSAIPAGAVLSQAKRLETGDRALNLPG